MGREAEVCCNRALELMPSPVEENAKNLATKAYYRKGRALELRGKKETAEKQFCVASKRSPSDRTVLDALSRLRMVTKNK